MNDWTNLLPPMLSGTELNEKLACYPEYDPEIRNGNASERLLGLSSLYDIYIPGTLSTEVYSKLYLATHRSIQKKQARKTVTMQLVQNRRRMLYQESGNGIIGGADSFSITGRSGIGKSSTISSSLRLINSNGIIETNEPYSAILPCVQIQTPFDSSVRSMLLEVLRVVDERLRTDYHAIALRTRATTDMLISSVSSVAINHVGTLIVDEIQNVVGSKNGDSLVSALTQLINSSGISIAMVGTPECESFFGRAFRLARRSLGIECEPMGFNDAFREFCKKLFLYCYVQNTPDFTEGIVSWLYEHSGGVPAIIISLLHDAQELSIFNGREQLDIQALESAYKQRLKMLHGYIETGRPRRSSTGTVRRDAADIPLQTTYVEDAHLMRKALDRSRDNEMPIVQMVKDSGILVTELRV
jgi:hypothetical protein